MVIGGFPLPGSAAPPAELELDPDDELPDEEDDEELPHAANATTVNRIPLLASARLNTDCIFSPLVVATVPAVCSGPSSARSHSPEACRLPNGERRGLNRRAAPRRGSISFRDRLTDGRSEEHTSELQSRH